MTDPEYKAPPVPVTQLAGPGVHGMEQDTPLYHFDVSAEDMADLIADPDDFATRLGLRPPRERPYGSVDLRVVPRDGGTSPEGGTSNGGTFQACCYSSGDIMVCHQH